MLVDDFDVFEITNAAAENPTIAPNAKPGPDQFRINPAITRTVITTMFDMNNKV